MFLDSPWLPLLIFLARIADVSIGTVRLICVMRGQRLVAVGLAFCEIMIWIYAVGSVLTQLDRFANIFGYACGFAAGNAVGMWLEQKLAMGLQMVTLLSRGRAHAVAEGLRFAGMPVTTLNASGRDGPVALCFTVAARKSVPTVLKVAREIDADVLTTISDVRESAFPLRPQLAGKIPMRLGASRGR
ncbi:MAG TPA: DUF5698 domain-containing protein [Phycisphaerae bacterium]|nr:DUF5698 domain-containing protein [Phycisphaerae bacterium]HNU45679.1 DUF5698 domain-containing protein [Phycisphaerae bacterium]